ARWYTDTLAKEGGVLIFYGSEQGLPAGPDRTLVGGQAGASLGNAVAGGGDVNGDGYDDLLAGAPFYDRDETDEGALFLYFGGPGGLAATPGWAGYGGEEGAWLGTAAALGDVNGDGYDDLVAGAPGDVLNVERGMLYVYYGSATGPGPLPNLVVAAGQIGSRFGFCLARAGDVNGDGYDDVLAGANQQEDDQPLEGAAFLYFGSPTGLHSAPDWIGWGEKADAGYGFAVGSAGIVNTTGLPAIAVGAPVYKLDREPVGRAFVHYGPFEPRARSYIWLPLIVHRAVP
ncbi:MAG TPA: integrin alpha, partial [Anaerolineae bacterium]|nr:integrin alpha [Anaerolineae bacterium]